MRRPRILVIGAGVAGSACGIKLGRHGYHVDLVEQRSFPRTKACGCCLGAAGLACLEDLSLRYAIGDHGMPTRRWIGSLGSGVVELALPPGLAVSRAVLDPILAAEAKNSGVNLWFRCQARVRHADPRKVSVTLQRESRRHEVDYDLVVMASGLASCGASAILPWVERPHGPFGVSFTATSDGFDPHTIYMACADDGYVGIVRLVDGSVDVAAALRSGLRWAREHDPKHRVKAILQNSAFAGIRIDGYRDPHTTPPLRRRRRFGNGRVIAVGDAAGYVEPFTGEGMTWALESGIAAAEMIAGSDDLDSLGDRWQSRLTQLLGRKRQVCGLVTNALRNRAVRRSAARLVSSFPGLATPLLSYLNKY